MGKETRMAFFSFSQLLLNKFLLQNTGNVCFKIIMHRSHTLVTYKLTSDLRNSPFWRLCFYLKTSLSQTAIMIGRQMGTLLIPCIRTFLKFLFLKFLFQSRSTSDLGKWSKHLGRFCTEVLYLPRQSCCLQLNIGLCFDFLFMKVFFFCILWYHMLYFTHVDLPGKRWSYEDNSVG